MARAPARSKFVVVKAVASCAVSQRGYAALQAERVRRWLADGGVKADLVSDWKLGEALAGRKLAYLAVCQKLSAEQLKALGRFRAMGGRIAVLQSYSPELAAFMGVEVPKGAPNRMLPPAATEVNGGWWSTNVFASDCEEDLKARLLLLMAGASVPGAWRASAWDARRAARRAEERACGSRQKPRSGEIHAVWDHTGEGLYPGDWSKTMRVLRANGVTDLFVNVAGAGFAHYASRVLPQSRVCRTSGDQLKACLAAARGTGVRVHAWVLCFNATRGEPGRLAALAKKGWRLKDRAGRLTEYLDPSNVDVRWHIMQAIDELTRNYAVAGVHLDFVRWYEGAAKPRNAARVVTAFVEAVRVRQRAVNPKAWLTAAVLPGVATCGASVGQDWGVWIDRGLVDYAVPMNYFPNRAGCAAALARQVAEEGRARRIISGIGVTANESVLAPLQVIEQVNAARAAGVAGVALFDLDRTLAERVLPVLRLGLFAE